MSRTFAITIEKQSNEALSASLIQTLMGEICLEELHDEAWKICRLSRCNECGTEINDLVDMYKQIPSEDLTIRFYDEEYVWMIIQTASGGGQCRDMKEACRKAFQLLFLKKLWEYDIDFEVTIS